MSDPDNSQRFAQRRVCLDCEETFTLGEMYPSKRYIDPLRCPYCRSDRTAIEGPQPS
jgi:DNA-directed RNA polymerase subunit RPC12/RpoP